MTGRVRVRLYIAGESPNSATALANVRSALASRNSLEVALEVIDVLREPDRGLRDGVLVSPMLVRLEPAPERRVLGTLRDRAALLAVLCLSGAPDD